MDKREQILDSALRLFVERGFHATPTSAITKDAGMSAGILFHYFPTKDDLIINLYVDLKKTFFEVAFSGLDKIKNNEGKIRLMWSNIWNWGFDNPLKFKFIQQADNSTYYQVVVEIPEVKAYFQQTYDFIQGAIDDHFVKNISSEFIMMSSFGLIAAMVQYLWIYPEKIHDHAFVEQAWESFIDCLKQ